MEVGVLLLYNRWPACLSDQDVEHLRAGQFELLLDQQVLNAVENLALIFHTEKVHFLVLFGLLLLYLRDTE